MPVGFLTLHIFLPGCTSLKEKRSRIRPILARLQREFNLSAAELDRQDAWQETVIGCAMVSNAAVHLEQALNSLPNFVERTWPDQPVLDHKLTILYP